MLPANAVMVQAFVKVTCFSHTLLCLATCILSHTQGDLCPGNTVAIWTQKRSDIIVSTINAAARRTLNCGADVQVWQNLTVCSCPTVSESVPLRVCGTSYSSSVSPVLTMLPVPVAAHAAVTSTQICLWSCWCQCSPSGPDPIRTGVPLSVLLLAADLLAG